MRGIFKSPNGTLRASVFAGTHVILIALDLPEDEAKELQGFAFKRSTGDQDSHWLEGMKVFPSLAPANTGGKVIRFPTNENPIQSFLWSDYEARPETKYTFDVSAMYGQPGNLQARETVRIEIKTEAEDDGQHGIWFNRGAIASQAFADQFNNASLTDDDYNDPQNKEVAWLSRGLLEACIQYIRETPEGDGLRVCAYEFTFHRVLVELTDALKRGVDVRIVYHDTGANKKQIDAAGLPAKTRGTTVLFKRTRPKTPHNKFIVRLKGNKKPVAVWTGSTNFTASGFLGQTNVGHKVTDPDVASTYLEMWENLSTNPESGEQHDVAVRLSPNPDNLVGKGTTIVFSPRRSDRMLNWYGERIADAATSDMFTGAFSVADPILEPMAKKGPAMRFILLERPPTPEIIRAHDDNPADLLFSYGAIFGKMQMSKADGHDADGKKTKKWVPIPQFKIEQWFLDEELERRNGEGFVFFIHTKFLLVDPLSNDPLVCTGSANFSGESLKSNDENMLLIRGNTRVADIYLTEFDRIFRHFYSRDITNEIARHHQQPVVGLLDDKFRWSGDYFNSANPKCHRRKMFFEDPKKSWSDVAKRDPDVFAGEGTRTRKPKARTNKAAKKTVKKKTRKVSRRKKTKS
jgi:phosphatidylserine/phosphatidylglycerophosphate/cardiolipin synthase-like enzyme